MQTQEQLKEFTAKKSLPSTPLNNGRNKGSFAVWTGFLGIVACGICCSLPFLTGIIATLGATAVVSLVWPLVGLGLVLVVGIIIFWLSRKYGPQTLGLGGSSKAGKAIHSLTDEQDTCTAISCSTQGTCGCKN